MATLLALAAVDAGAGVAPAWNRDFAAPILWQRVTAFGHLVVATDDGLFAVDADSGEARWSHPDLGGLPGDSFDELEGSPLVVIDSAKGLANRRTVVLDVFTGTVVLDSRAQNLADVVSTHVLPRSGSLLIAGFEHNNPQPRLHLYRIDDGSRLWASDAINYSATVPGMANMGQGLQSLMTKMMNAALVATGETPVRSAPFELDDGTFLLGAMNNLFRFDQATGNVLWKAEYAGDSYEFRLAAQRPGIVFVGSENHDTMSGADGTAREYVQTFYQGFDVDDGTPLWKRPTRFDKPMNRLIIPVEQGLIVSEGDSDKGRIQLLAYDTGEGQWGNRGRGIEFAGRALDYAFAGSDLVLTSGYDSIWTNKDTEYLLHVLDPNAGVMRFPKPFTVKGRMVSTQLTDRGLVYTTTHEINVFDPATGTLLNEPVLRSKEPLAVANGEAVVFAFNPSDGHVYRFDRETAAITRFSKAPFAFEGGDHAVSLESLDDGLVLLGQQTVAGFRSDGTLAFAVHHPAPRDPAWMRSLAWAAGVRAGMASAYAGIYSAAAADAAGDLEDGTAGDAVATEMSRGFAELQQGYQGLATSYIDLARRRYRASAESRDFVFMMIQDERRVLLAQISKRDGSVLAQIDLARDKEPQYQVDDVDSMIFYQSAASTIAAYRFSPEQVNVALR